MANELEQNGTLEAEAKDDAVKTAIETDAQTLEAKPGDSPEIEDEAVDYEAILLSEPGETDEDKEQLKEEPDKAETGDSVNVSARLDVLKDIAAKLAELKESPDERNTITILRKLNKELVRNQETELSQLKDTFAIGTPSMVKDALALVDGLYGYDTAKGIQTAEKFAQSLAEKDPAHAYQTGLDLMMQKGADGVTNADLFVRNVLGLDLTRLADFQKISRGEVVAGYETSNPAELATIPSELHEAYKRLTPKMRDIVKDGTQTYASEAERVEALKILSQVERDIRTEKADKDRIENEKVEFATSIDRNYNDLASEFNRTVPQRLSKTLDNLVFSSDEHINQTMKYGLSSTMRDILDPDLQPNAKTYFTNLGIDGAEVDRQFQKANQLFTSIQSSIEIEANANARKQTVAAQTARNSRIENEKRLVAVGVSLAAQVARITGAKAAKVAGNVKVPENRLPNVPDNSSLGNPTGKRLTAADVLAATQKGEDVRAYKN